MLLMANPRREEAFVMKRFCVFALVIIMLLSTSALAAKYPIMLKDDGIKVIVRDAYYKHSDFDDSHELVFDVEASNETKENYMITSITGYVNGWEVDAHAYISVAKKINVEWIEKHVKNHK